MLIFLRILQAAVREMKEVQFYYSASASLLQELVVEKYSKLFAKHRISIDVLPLLNETNLIEVGALFKLLLSDNQFFHS